MNFQAGVIIGKKRLVVLKFLAELIKSIDIRCFKIRPRLVDLLFLLLQGGYKNQNRILPFWLKLILKTP